MMGLDFEKNPMYKFQILATDQSSNPKTSSCSVTINVLDICDEVPQLTTVISLSKDKIVGASVFSLKSSENGTNYNISAGKLISFVTYIFPKLNVNYLKNLREIY